MSSSFTYDMGLKFTESVTAEAGIPLVEQGEVTVSSEQSFEWHWNTENSQTTDFKQTTPVSIPPGKKVQMIAQVQVSNLDVGYHARVRTSSGNEMDVNGVWHGVSVYNLEVKQQDLPPTGDVLV